MWYVAGVLVGKAVCVFADLLAHNQELFLSECNAAIVVCIWDILAIG